MDGIKDFKYKLIPKLLDEKEIFLLKEYCKNKHINNQNNFDLIQNNCGHELPPYCSCHPDCHNGTSTLPCCPDYYQSYEPIVNIGCTDELGNYTGGD